MKTRWLLACLLALGPAVCSADVVMSYEGMPFDLFFPDDSTNPFDSNDRITGTVTFAAVGDAQAIGFTLSTTVGGGPGYTFSVADVLAPPLSVTVVRNEDFIWNPQSGVPISGRIDVIGEVLPGSPGNELLSISGIGDLASLDIGPGMDVGADNATNFTAGAWSLAVAVPEPSGAAGIALVSVALFFAQRRRSSQARPLSTLK